MEMARLAASTAAFTLLSLLALLNLAPVVIRGLMPLIRWIYHWLTCFMRGSPPSRVLLVHASACIWTFLLGTPANYLLLLFFPQPFRHNFVLAFVLIVAWSWGMILGFAFVPEQTDNG